MFFLPVYVRNFGFTAHLINSETFESLNSIYYRNPYTANFSESFLTQKKVLEILKSNLKDKLSSDTEIIYITDEDFVNDIKSTYIVSDVLSKIGLPAVILDYSKFNNISKLTKDEINTYFNQVKYSEDLDFDIRLKIEKDILITFIYDSYKNIQNSKEILICTNQIDKGQKTQYITELVNVLSENIYETGLIKVNFEDNFELICKASVLIAQNVKVSDYFKKNLITSVAKLILGHDLDEVEVTKDAEDLKILKVNAEKLTLLKLGEDEKAHIKWKSQKSKFDAQIYGAKMGVLFRSISNNDKV